MKEFKKFYDIFEKCDLEGKLAQLDLTFDTESPAIFDHGFEDKNGKSFTEV